MGRIRQHNKIEGARQSPLAVRPTSRSPWREGVRALRLPHVELALGALIPVLAFLAYLPAISGDFT